MATQRQHDRALARVRALCLALPEVSERLSHGSPSFFIRGKKTLAMFVDDHHGDGILGIWVPAFPGVQEELVETEPDRFFRPPYVGPSGWVGVRLDRVHGPSSWPARTAPAGGASYSEHPKTGASFRSADPVRSRDRMRRRPGLSPSWPRDAVSPPLNRSRPSWA